MSEIKLLPCPCCGGEAEIKKQYNRLTGENTICIQCAECNMKTDELNCDIEFGFEHMIANEVLFINPLEELVKVWNTRKPMERINERLEEEADKWRDTQKQDLDNGYNNRFALGMVMGLDVAIETIEEVGGIE